MKKKKWFFSILLLFALALIIFIVNFNKFSDAENKIDNTKHCIGEYQEISIMPVAPNMKREECCPGLKIKTSCIGPNGDIIYPCYGFDVGICSK